MSCNFIFLLKKIIKSNFFIKGVPVNMRDEFEIDFVNNFSIVNDNNKESSNCKLFCLLDFITGLFMF